MAKPIAPIPAPAILLEMSGFASFTEYLARRMSPALLAKLSPAARKARRLAQIRSSRARTKLRKLVARHDALSPTLDGRDIIEVRSPVLLA